MTFLPRSSYRATRRSSTRTWFDGSAEAGPRARTSRLGARRALDSWILRRSASTWSAASKRSTEPQAFAPTATAPLGSTSASTRSTSCSNTGSSTTRRSPDRTSSRTTCATVTIFRRTASTCSVRASTSSGVPFSWGLSDFQYFEFVPGVTVRQDTPSAVYEIWHGELEWAHAHVPGGVYDLTMHPQAIGRGHRLVMVERLIEAAKALDDDRLRAARRLRITLATGASAA